MMTSPSCIRRRRGFSLTVVLLFLLLVMYLWAVVYRTTSTLVRVQTARIQRDMDDAGMRNALAQGLMYLEQNPTLDRDAGPYRHLVKVVNAQVQQWAVDNEVTFADGAGKHARYTVTISVDPSGPKSWKVEVSAYDPSVTDELRLN